MLRKQLSIILFTVIGLVGLASCTPTQVAAWESLTQDQKVQILNQVKTDICAGKDTNCLVGWSIAKGHGWTEEEFACADKVVMHESAWKEWAANPSGAYGIPQALPGSKMAVYGSDWRSNPATQIRWMYDYMIGRYGGPCQAWRFKSSNGWY